ncbi:hypothetical protein CY35_20G008300, partial [Sphagnum magellanicum]
SANFIHSVYAQFIIICRSKLVNFFLIASPPVAISLFRKASNPRGEKKRGKISLQDWSSYLNKPCNFNKTGLFETGLARKRSEYTRLSNSLRGLAKRFAI